LKDYRSIWSDLKYTTFSQGFLDAGGIRTRFLSSGTPEKPLLVLLHGAGGHAETYIRNLAAHGQHFWVYAIDLVGHGWTDKPDISYEIPAYADHVLKVIAALGRKTAYISGESLGGWVATHLAIHFPETVEKLVLNTTGGWTAHPNVMERIKELSMQAVENPTYEALKARLEFLMFDKSMVYDDLIETRRAIYAQSGFADVMRKLLCLQEMDIRRRNMFTAQDYPRIKCPTLVLWTSHDPTATPAEGQQIASMIPVCKFVVMNKCGHWPQFEDAQAFNHLQLDFFLGNGTQ
jgi:2-hydroxy-6-oxonona-2,4-dienedioate hydrolase